MSHAFVMIYSEKEKNNNELLQFTVIIMFAEGDNYQEM